MKSSAAKKKIVIIADDLTGACDTAVKLCANGDTAEVFLDGQIRGIGMPGVAVNTENRALSAEEAYERIFALARELRGRKDVRVYKKIDSLFRGNVVAETEALMAGLGLQGALINAAVPGSHREIRDGKLDAPGSIRHGMDILSSVFAGREADCVVFPLETVRAGSAGLAARIKEALTGGKRFLIVDSVTKEDLETTAEAYLRFEEDLLLVGAAGFIVPFVKEEPSGQGDANSAKEENCRREERFAKKKNKAPLFYILGTNNPTTVEQTRFLAETENVPILAVRAEEIRKGNKEAERARLISSAELLLRNDPEILVLTVSDGTTDPKKDKASVPAENREIADCCTEVAAALIKRIPFGALVVSGGTTARSLLDRMDVRRLRVFSEYAPGVPVAEIGNNRYGDMMIATKSGGYGERETLYDLKRFFSQ